MRKLSYALSIVAVSVAETATIRVPADYPSIQAAILVSAPGDSVLIAPGTYAGRGNRNIDFAGKAIILTSERGSEETIIDCSQQGRGFIFQRDEERSSIVEGLTVANGLAPDGRGGGGMLFLNGSSPLVRDCAIINNGAHYISGFSNAHGGGIAVYESSPTFLRCEIGENVVVAQLWEGDPCGGGIYVEYGDPIFSCCRIHDNVSTGYDGGRSGGIHVRGGSPMLLNCVIENNKALAGAHLWHIGIGGGITIDGESYARIVNCTVVDNRAILGESAAGLLVKYWYGSPFILNSIFADNDPSEVEVQSTTVIAYCCIQSESHAGVGNIDDPPKFREYFGHDYTLGPTSPCIDAGAPELSDRIYDQHPLWPEWHVDGVRSDMGAYGGPNNSCWLRSHGAE